VSRRLPPNEELLAAFLVGWRYRSSQPLPGNLAAHYDLVQTLFAIFFA
jgi:hypothetical protein